jgi:hypothetical protein
MRMPSLNAEASLYRSGRQYRSAGKPTAMTSINIRPALFPPSRCIRACEFAQGCALTRCLCECEGGVYSPYRSPGFPCGRCIFE